MGFNELDHPIVGVHPNPANEKIIVDVNAAGNVSILDAAGKVMLTSGVNAGENTINVSQLDTGVYTIVFDGMNTSAQRVVIQ